MGARKKPAPAQALLPILGTALASPPRRPRRYGTAFAESWRTASRVSGRLPPRDSARYPRYLSYGLTLERFASLLKQADQGYLHDLLALIQEIAGRDGLIQGLLATRLSALSRRALVCEKNDPDEVRGEQVAAFCQEILDQLRLLEPQIDGSYREVGRGAGMVEALDVCCLYGLSAGWRHWVTRPGDPRPVPLYAEFFDERRFGFDIATETLHLSSADGASRGLPVTQFDPALFFEVRSTRLARRLSYAGAGRTIAWYWILRHEAAKQMHSYLEAWGLPWVFGKTSAEVAASYSEDAHATFKNLVEDAIGDTRGTLPPGFELQVIQAAQGGEKSFELYDQITERAIQFALVGNTGTSSGEGGSLAKAEVNERIQASLVDGDARLVGEAIESYLAPAVALWFGPGVPVPTVSFAIDETVESARAKSLVLQSSTYPLIALLNRGVPIDVTQYAKDFGMPLLPEGKAWDPRVPKLPPLAVAEAGAPEPGGTPSPGGLPVDRPDTEAVPEEVPTSARFPRI